MDGKEEMTEQQLRAVFPRASEEFIRANCGEVKVDRQPIEVKEQVQAEANKLNKLEQAFLLRLRAENPKIYIQAITLKLADDCRYTPDFVAIKGNSIMVYEVKGFMRDDALVKLKVAARMFSWMNFVLVTRKGKDNWIYANINP